MTDKHTEAWAEALAACDVTLTPLHTIELWHPTFDVAARIVVDHGEMLSEEPLIIGRWLKLEYDAPREPGEWVKFVAGAIKLDLPRSREGQLPELVMSIDNVSGELMPLLRKAAQAGDGGVIECVYRQYFLEQPGTVQRRIMGLTITQPRANQLRVEARATPPDIGSIPFTTSEYNATDNPTLTR